MNAVQPFTLMYFNDGIFPVSFSKGEQAEAECGNWFSTYATYSIPAFQYLAAKPACSSRTYVGSNGVLLILLEKELGCGVLAHVGECSTTSTLWYSPSPSVCKHCTPLW